MAIAVDNDGYMYVTGQSYSSSSDRDCLTIKYNSMAIQFGLENIMDLIMIKIVDERLRLIIQVMFMLQVRATIQTLMMTMQQ